MPSQSAYARQTVLAAADMLKALGHGDFDRFLLELDLPNQNVGKRWLMAPPTSLADAVMKKDILATYGLGDVDHFWPERDLVDRVTSLAEYAIKNPEQLSPQRRTVAYEMIKRAAQLWREGVNSNLTEGECEKFASAMLREGQPLTLNAEQFNLTLWRPEDNSGVVPPIAMAGLVEPSSPPPPKEMLTLKPTFMGISLDLKELFHRIKARWENKK